mmetsp:Transcript_31277/g.63004  ORF Transcript_31277/g.63004 Transcript_31277/m.63004 type:complete len:192 (-) Transcript_31277:167-742(-)
MHSTRSHSPPPLTDSSGHPCKKRSIAKMKKTVKFSPNAKVRSAAKYDDLQAHSSWFTADELSSMKKRAKNLSILHYIKTRPGQPNAPSNLSGIVYNCHPAHYEIIGESLRGMEHRTDISQALRRERLRSDAISLIHEHQNLDETTRSKKLAWMCRERTNEAMLYSRKIAEEDASVAAAILAEDLKHFSSSS